MNKLVSYGTTTPALRWSSLRTRLLWAYDGQVAADALDVTDDHRSGYWLWLLRRGRVEVKLGNRKWEAGAGEWLMSPHGITTQHFSRDAHILSVHFQCHWPTGEDLFVETGGLVFPSERSPQLERSAASLAGIVFRNFPGVRLLYMQQPISYSVFLKIEQRFLELMRHFFDTMIELNCNLSQGGEGDERTWRAAECLHSAPLDGEFPAAQLQRETSLGRAQLDRLFGKSFGTTTREYWERLRKESAMDSLEATRMSIKEIGYRLGFKQPSHFTNWFSRRVGMTPVEYRNRPAVVSKSKEGQFSQ